jgi:MFS transporter, ACDE family, multidrug resistance protein
MTTDGTGIDSAETVLAVDGRSFARLSGIEGFTRSVLSGVVPIVALEALGNKAAVSYTYLVGAALTLAVTLNLGWIERRISRRWVLTASFCSLVTSAGVFAFSNGPLLAVGIALASFAASAVSVCVALLTMDSLEKSQIARNESRRMAYHGFAWLVGPTLGLWLWDRSGRDAPFIVSAGAGLFAMVYLWVKSIGSSTPNRVHLAQPTNPIRTVSRYFRQPRLRTAYVITTVRSVFWFAVFVYGPIYVLEAGMPKWVGGLMLSSFSALLLMSRAVHSIAQSKGTRWIVIRGFMAITLGMAGLAILGDAQPIGLVAWAVAAVGGAALDVVGNIPFMRSVRPRERVEMTGVFSTWREFSSLVAPAIAAVSLGVGSFRVFYIVLAGLAAGTATLATTLPRRL